MGDPVRAGRHRAPPEAAAHRAADGAPHHPQYVQRAFAPHASRPSPLTPGTDGSAPQERQLPRGTRPNAGSTSRTNRSTHVTSGQKERTTVTRTTTIRALAVLAALGLGLTACSSGHSSGGSSASSSGGSSKAVVGKTLVIEDNPVTSFTEDFNPFVGSAFASGQNANSLVFEPLFQINSLNASQAPIPWLALSYTWSNDNKTVTLKLRPNVKWSDGQAFTAKDVVFTFNLLKQYPAANTGGAPTITSASATDDTTAVLNFATPQAANLVGIAQQLIVPEHVWSSVGDPTKAVIKSAQAIGTGPFTVDKFTAQKVTYKANPGFWGPKPQVPAIEFPAIASNDAAQLALANGQIDLTGNNIPNVQNVFVAKDPQHNHLFQSTAPYYPQSNVVSLFLNQKSPSAPALADKAVRQAISAGVDRQTLASQCETDYEAPATSSGGLIASVDKASIPAALTNDLKPNTDAAKVTSLLTADGYTKTGGKWSKGGKTIKFSVLDPTDYSDYFCGAQDIVKQLDGLGFDATLVQGVQSTEWSQKVANGQYDATIHWGQGSTTFQRLQYLLDDTTTAAVGQPAGGDIERYSNPDAQKALSTYEAADPSDSSALQSAIGSLQQIVSTDVPAVPLMYGAAWYQYNDADYTNWPTSANPYMNPSPNSQAYEYIVLQLKAVK